MLYSCYDHPISGRHSDKEIDWYSYFAWLSHLSIQKNITHHLNMPTTWTRGSCPIYHFRNFNHNLHLDEYLKLQLLCVYQCPQLQYVWELEYKVINAWSVWPYILDKMVYNSLLHGPSLPPGSGTLISPSPPEFQAVTWYMGHELSFGVFFLNDVSVTFTSSM